MPYIKPEKRHVLDPHIDGVLNALRELESDDPTNSMEGNMVYVIYKMLVRVYANGNFDNRSDAIKVLQCAHDEYYRKKMGPYEDQKEFENGTID